jgi:hypothetical protein
MTTSRDFSDMPPTPEPLQPLLHDWLRQSGAISALPGAPVAAHRPTRRTLALRWLARRRYGRLDAEQGPVEGAATQPPTVPASVC